MIVEQFDHRTMAAIEVALEKACACWPNGGKHNLRKRVAQSIIRCAKSGNTSLDALTDAGERARAQLSQIGTCLAGTRETPRRGLSARR